MNAIDECLKNLSRKKRIGLMTHAVVGYPTLAISEKLIKTLIKAGSDLIELQIPFSDPISDGPTIMRACDLALKNGTKTRHSLTLIEKIAKNTTVPLLVMAYYNTIFRYGVDNFCQDISQAGASGLIIPDIPPEEEHAEHYIEIAQQRNLYSIRIISPASTVERLKKNAAVSKGFVYCISRFGTTGRKETLPKDLPKYLARVRRYFKIPIAVGFGISKPEHIRILSKCASIVVLGSVIIDLLDRKKSNRVQAVNNFIKKLVNLTC